MSYPPTGGQPPYGQPPPGYGYGPPPQPPAPDHPRATTSMVLGIVAVAGGFVCYLPILMAPFAWVVGRKTLREIDASQGRVGGRGMAMAGYVLGIIGSVLLGLALLVVAVIIVGFAVSETSTSTSTAT